MYTLPAGRLKLFSVCPQVGAGLSANRRMTLRDCAWRLRLAIANALGESAPPSYGRYGYCTIGAQCTVHIHTARKAGKVEKYEVLLKSKV